MLFAFILAACTVSAPEPKDSEPDTDGGRAAAAVKEEAKAASAAVDGLVEQVKAVDPVSPVAPVESAPVVAPAPVEVK